MQSQHVPGRYESGDYVVDVEEDRTLVLWSTESGDAIAVPPGDARVVLMLLCEAYVASGRFASDRERKAYAESLAATS